MYVLFINLGCFAKKIFNQIDMVKNYRFATVILVALLLVFGCQNNHEANQESDCSVVINTKVDPSLRVMDPVASRSAGVQIPTQVDDFMATIVMMGVSNDTMVRDQSLNLSNNKFDLVSGGYQINLVSAPYAASGCQFDVPIYRAISKFDVKAENTTQIDVTAKLGCAVVQVEYSDRVKQGFAQYSTKIWLGDDPNNALSYGEASANRLGYFDIAESGAQKTLNYAIEVITSQGYKYTSQGKVDGLHQADLLKLNFDIEPPVENGSSPAVIELKLTSWLNAVERRFEYGMNHETMLVPVISGRYIDLSSVVSVKYKEGADVRIDVYAPGKLKKLLVMFEAGQGSINGVDQTRVYDLMDEANLSLLGIEVLAGGMEGAEETLININKLTSKMEVGDAGKQAYTVTLGALDMNGQYSARAVRLEVVGGATIITNDLVGADIIDWFGARGERNKVNILLSGSYNPQYTPTTKMFMYRLKGGNWNNIVNVTETEIGLVESVVSLPADGKDYEFRFMTDLGAGKSVAATMPVYATLANMNLDSWSGNNPNSPWSSPNNTFATTTRPDTGWMGIGRCARAESVSAVGNFASGAIFTGGMVVVMPPNAYKSSQMGVAFTQRPKKLVGYFKYNGATINKHSDGGATGNTSVNGGPDQCEISVKLEYWNGGSYRIRWKDGFFGNPGGSYVDAEGNPTQPHLARVVDYDGNGGSFDPDIRSKMCVGYGKFTSQGQPEWTRFEVNIDYYQDIMPDYITIAGVSSAWGGYMTGGLGSTLWIDDLEFVY